MRTLIEPAKSPSITIFFDGACPLCRQEISLLQRLARPGKLEFVDLAQPDAQEVCPLPHAQMLARFHIEIEDGQLVSGARAFFLVWSQVRGLGWLRALSRVKPVVWLAERAYRVFLHLRPALQRLARSSARR